MYVCVCVCTISVIGWGGELFRKGWRGGLQLGKQIIHQKKLKYTTSKKTDMLRSV